MTLEKNQDTCSLNIHIVAKEPIQTLEDTVKLKAQPDLRITIPLLSDADKALNDTLHFELLTGIEKETGDPIASLYYAEHQGLDNNIIDIRRVGDNLYYVTWRAETCDVNFYDGSKPVTVVEVETEAQLK